MSPDELGISLTAKAPVVIGQHVSIDAIAMLSLARMLNLAETTPHPLRPSGGLCGRPFSRAASGPRAIDDRRPHRQSSRVEPRPIAAAIRLAPRSARACDRAATAVATDDDPSRAGRSSPAAAELTYTVPRRGCRGIRADRRRRRTTRQGPEQDTLGRSRQRVTRWRAGDGRRMSSDERGRERHNRPEHECRLDERKGVIGEHRGREACDDAANAAASMLSGLPLVRGQHDRAGEGFGRSAISNRRVRPGLRRGTGRATGCRGSVRFEAGCPLRSASCPRLARGSACACLR